MSQDDAVATATSCLLGDQPDPVVVVVDRDHQPLGVLTPESLLAGELVRPLRANVHSTPHEVAHRLTTRSPVDTCSPVVVTDNAGRCLGVVTIRRLLSALAGVDALVPLDAGEDGFDLYCPLLSLPVHLAVSDAARHPPARLNARRGEAQRWSALLSRAGGRLRVGILWSGSESYANNRHRAAQLTDFLPLLELPSVQLFSLQKGPQQAALREAGLGSLIIETDDCDFSETAALVERLDLVVLTDTALAHLAASLGKPVWLLLDTAPFWLYGKAGEHCPWYPSMRLFRQADAGDWRDVLRRVCDELAAHANQRLGASTPAPDRDRDA